MKKQNHSLWEKAKEIFTEILIIVFAVTIYLVAWLGRTPAGTKRSKRIFK